MRIVRTQLLSAVARLVTAVTLLVQPASASAASESPKPPHYKVQLAVLIGMLQDGHISWPEAAGKNSDDSLVIGLVGDDGNIARALDELRNKLTRKRLEVVRVDTPGSLPEKLHVLFISESARPQQEAIRKALTGRVVLTVGNFPGFAETGGILGFFVTPEKKVGFNINDKAARAAGLVMTRRIRELAARTITE